MTAGRRKQKQYSRFLLAFAGLLPALAAAAPPVSVAATTERLVVDWHTGLAIGGYDPVADVLC